MNILRPGIFKQFVIIMLALAVFTGTLLVESGLAHDIEITVFSKVILVPSEEGAQMVRGSQISQVKSQIELQHGDVVITGDNQTAVIRFDGNGIMRLAPQSKLMLRLDEAASPMEIKYIFFLEQGKLWGNTLFTDAVFNVLAGTAMVLPGKAVFAVDFDGDKTLIRVAANQIKVGLLAPDVNVLRLVEAEDAALINSFLLGQGSQTVIVASNFLANVETFRKLLYSKLIKEFQYSLVDKEVWNTNSWVAQNLAADSELSKQVSQQEFRLINLRNLKIPSLNSFSYQLQKAAHSFANVLTFSKTKVLERELQNIFAHLYDSEYLLVFGRAAEAKERLLVFKQLVLEKSQDGDPQFRSLLLAKLRQSYKDLVFVLPDEPLFEVKVAVSAMLAEYLGEDALVEKFQLIRDYLNFAYALADKNALLARLTLEQYYARFKDFVQVGKTRLLSIKYFILEENQLMDNLLRQFFQFYQDGFFAMKHDLENQWLVFMPEGGAKNEERQTIVSTKIDFLKHLQQFFLEGQIPLNDARLIVFRLINEIKDLQSDAAVGVSELFALRLKDYGQFLRFLNSTELATLQGASFRKKYDEFLAAQLEQISIEQAVKEFLGEQPEGFKLTPEQVIEQVKDDFAVSGVTDLELGSLIDLGQRLIAVQGSTLDKIVFQGQYDWDQKLILDVRVKGASVTTEAISLDTLLKLLAPKRPKPSPLQHVTIKQAVEQSAILIEQPTVSKAQQVAKILLLQKLKASDIAVEESKIIVTDLAGGLFVISDAKLIDKPEVVFNFHFKNRENLAELVVVSSPKGHQAIPGHVALADLGGKVTAVYLK